MLMRKEIYFQMEAVFSSLFIEMIGILYLLLIFKFKRSQSSDFFVIASRPDIWCLILYEIKYYALFCCYLCYS